MPAASFQWDYPEISEDHSFSHSATLQPETLWNHPSLLWTHEKQIELSLALCSLNRAYCLFSQMIVWKAFFPSLASLQHKTQALLRSKTLRGYLASHPPSQNLGWRGRGWHKASQIHISLFPLYFSSHTYFPEVSLTSVCVLGVQGEGNCKHLHV